MSRTADPTMADADIAAVKKQILDFKMQISDHMQSLLDKIERIRDNAERYERDAIDRTYAEIEPMRRQMEAMILALADYESLRAPPPVYVDPIIKEYGA